MMLPFEDLSPEDLAFVNDFIVDGLKAFPSGRPTLEAISRYDLEARLPLVEAPTLIIESTGDLEPALLQRAAVAQQLLPGSRIAKIPRGYIHMIDSRAGELSRILLDFFEEVGQRTDRGM